MVSTESNKLFLTPNQAAKLLNVSLATLKKFIKQGKLKTIITPGGHHRIFKEDLMRLTGGAGEGDGRDSMLFDLTESFMKVIETRQRFCKGHSAQVGRIAAEIANHLGLSRESSRRVRLGAMLHDIGKFTVSRDILNKSGKLSEEEYTQVKQHCRAGQDILKSLEPYTCVADIISQHHERFDGSGYPLGLKGSTISVEARIISLADSFDAMTSPTSYKKALTTERAFMELKNYSGSQFDPQIVDTFLASFKK